MDPASSQAAIYRKQCEGPGAIISFELEAGKAAAFRFLNAVKLRLAVSLGGTESLVEHPATMTHSDIPPEIQQRFGITDRLIFPLHSTTPAAWTVFFDRPTRRAWS